MNDYEAAHEARRKAQRKLAQLQEEYLALGVKYNTLRGDVLQLKDTLTTARNRIADMLQGDDGQAWKEAEKALAAIDAVINKGTS